MLCPKPASSSLFAVAGLVWATLLSCPAGAETPDTEAPTWTYPVTFLSKKPSNWLTQDGMDRLSWNEPAADDVGVTMYVVYLDGQKVGEVDATSRKIDLAFSGKAATAYRVEACDAAGNCTSGQVLDQKGVQQWHAARAKAHRDQVQAKIAGKSLLALIGAKGEGREISSVDVFGQGTAIEGRAAGFDGTRETGGASPQTSERRGGGGAAGDIRAIDASGGASSSGTPAPPTLAVAWRDVQGEGIDTKRVSRVLRARARAFGACIENVRRGDKIEGAAFDVRIKVGMNGRTEEAKVSGEPRSAQRCATSVLKRLRFPKPKQPTTVTAKLTATPAAQP